MVIKNVINWNSNGLNKNCFEMTADVISYIPAEFSLDGGQPTRGWVGTISANGILGDVHFDHSVQIMVAVTSSAEELFCNQIIIAHCIDWICLQIPIVVSREHRGNKDFCISM